MDYSFFKKKRKDKSHLIDFFFFFSCVVRPMLFLPLKSLAKFVFHCIYLFICVLRCDQRMLCGLRSHMLIWRLLYQWIFLNCGREAFNITSSVTSDMLLAWFRANTHKDCSSNWICSLRDENQDEKPGCSSVLLGCLRGLRSSSYSARWCFMLIDFQLIRRQEKISQHFSRAPT